MIVLCDGSSLGLLCGEWVVGGMPGSGETNEEADDPSPDEREWGM